MASTSRTESEHAAYCDSLPAGPAQRAIAGAGREDDKLREFAGPHVLLLGVLNRERDLPRPHASADAFLFSSHTETLGLVSYSRPWRPAFR